MLTLDLEEAEHVMFLKFESWKKAYSFKEASIFEDGRLQELGSLLALGRRLSEPFGVKIFQPLQMRRIPLFIEFIDGLKPGWSMDQTHALNHMNLGYI